MINLKQCIFPGTEFELPAKIEMASRKTVTYSNVNARFWKLRQRPENSVYVQWLWNCWSPRLFLFCRFLFLFQSILTLRVQSSTAKYPIPWCIRPRHIRNTLYAAHVVNAVHITAVGSLVILHKGQTYLSTTLHYHTSWQYVTHCWFTYGHSDHMQTSNVLHAATIYDNPQVNTDHIHQLCICHSLPVSPIVHIWFSASKRHGRRLL